MLRLAKVLAFLLAGTLAMSSSANGAGAPLVINEFMAANSGFIPDAQGETDDWLEIHNAGSQIVDAAGMYLTDDLDVPTKWKIPENVAHLTLVPPNGHLIVWLDNDTTDFGLHANFELNSMGDEIALFDTDGTTLIDAIRFKNQRGNISYGRSPDGADTWRFLMVPTPGVANAPAYEDVVADTKFSRDRGFYDEPFEVTITCATPGATIYYTLDGSDPTSASGRLPAGQAYSGPIPIARTTCLRAVAFRDGWLPSNVDTQTYIFLDDVITRTQASVTAQGYPSQWYSSYPADYEMDPQVYTAPAYADLMDDAMLAIPTVSLVTNKGHLFNRVKNAETGGIYIYTGHGSTGGQDWERPISVELFTPDGDREFQVNCGVRIQGGENRNPPKCPKHSLGLRFRGVYGPTRFEFPLFENSPVDRFDSFQFRGFFNNSWTHWAPNQRERTQYIRDQWMRDSQLEMGHPDAGRGFYVHLYINGIYWGMYNLQERPVASHYAAYNGGDPERIDAINGGSATDGTTSAWSQTRSIAGTRDWARIQEVIDIDNFIDWTLLNLFAGNTDLKDNGNWRAAGGGPDQAPWRFYCWDGEHVMESLYQSGTRPSSDPTRLFNLLDDIEEFRIRFGDRVHKHLFNGGALTAERNAQRWLRRADEIELAVIAESARWGDYRRDVHSYSSGPYHLYTRDEFWIPEKNELLNNYFPRRTDVALDQFKSRGLYPNTTAPAFHIGGAYQHGGRAASGSMLSMPAVGGTIWYTVDGSDPRLPDTSPEPADEVKFVAENASKRVLVPTGPVSDTWRASLGFNDAAWQSGTGGVGYERSSGYQALFKIDVQNEMYGRNTSCYIRIPFSVTAQALQDLASLTLRVRYDDGFVAYLNGIEVQRAGFNGTPAWNSSAAGSHSDSLAVNLEPFNISDHIDTLHTGTNLLAIHGLNQGSTSSDFLISAELVGAEAPAGGGQSGVSPSAVRYTGPVPLDRSVCVKARALAGVSWSAVNEAVYAVGPVAESLRISEIMYHPANTGNPDDPNTEFIELTNVGSQTVNLNLVRFTNGVEYTFPDFELPVGGYCLIVRDIPAFEARYGANLPVVGQYAGSLNNAGERVEFADAIGTVIQSFRFEDNWYDLTDGLGFSLTVKDPPSTDVNSLDNKGPWRPSAETGGSPGTDDRGDLPEIGSVVINELLANSEGSDPDWIELRNTTGRSIPIGGWFLSDDADDLMKYEIAAGTSIPAGRYVVLDENSHFGNEADPGCAVPFALSSNGETVYLHSGSGGVLTGYSEQEKFDASDPGVTLGRYQKSTGSFNFVALQQPTPGAANAEPVVGPVVINEIMYHPPESSDAEYVELLNISSSPVMLYDALRKAPWRFTDDPDNPGIDLLLPTDPPVTLAAGEYLVLAKDLTAFNANYTAPAGVTVLAWEAGKLANGTEKIQLSKPGDADADGNRPWIRVDRVVYSDGSHPESFAEGIDPWPAAADGQGSSLTRIDPDAYGNDPANWHATLPSPGRANP